LYTEQNSNTSAEIFSGQVARIHSQPIWYRICW